MVRGQSCLQTFVPTRASSESVACSEPRGYDVRAAAADGHRQPSNLDRYERIAPFYDLLDFPFEFGRYRKIRPLFFQGLTGRILDAGVGTGRNIPFYPPGSEVVGIDISPAMLARAERRRLWLGADVDLRQMDVTQLEFPDQSFDAAIATFLFCVLPDDLQAPALRELARVVKPRGMIRLLEYVRPRGVLRRVSAGWLETNEPHHRRQHFAQPAFLDHN